MSFCDTNLCAQRLKVFNMTTTRGRPTATVVLQRRNVQRARADTKPRRGLPEYLEARDVEALIRYAPNRTAALVFLVQWRAGLRVSEALALTKADITLHDTRPTLRVRKGKGAKERIVPVHPELAEVLANRWIAASNGLLFPSQARRAAPEATVTRGTAYRWIRDALAAAQAAGRVEAGRKVATHTLRHSAARHWLSSGVPINVVSRWLGHASLQTTLIYLEILPDPLGDMARVP